MKKIFTCALFILLAACTTIGGSTALQTPNYSAYGKTRLDVNEIQVVNDYIPPYAAPNVEHQLFLPPYTAIRDWSVERFQAVGNMGVAKLHIVNAAIVKRDKPVKAGAEGWFYNQVDAEYEMNVLVRLEIISPSYDNRPFAEVKVSRKLETTEGMTLNQRDAALNQMVLDMVNDLDRLMTESIRNNLNNIIR